MPETSNGDKKPNVQIIVAVIAAVAAVSGAAIGIIPDLIDSIVTARSTPTSITPASPTPTQSQSPTQPIQTQQALKIHLWLAQTECHPGGTWTATLRVEPRGGDGTYTYYNDGDWVAGPTDTPIDVELNGAVSTPLEGTITVESGDQIKSQDYSIPVPAGCSE